MATSKAPRTLVFIPTYEERDNVRPMLEQLAIQMPNADIVFMDDNSPDGTGNLLDELAKKMPRLTVIHRSGKLGVGGAHLEGIAYAYDRGYDVLVTLDCDFTHSPSDIPILVAKAADADITVGSRFIERDSLPGWSIVRKLLTNLGHAITLNMLGIRGDATGAFRVYRLSTVPKEMFDLVRARGYAFFFESLFIANSNGLAIQDVAIKLPARTQGHSKMSLREIQRSILQLIQLSIAKKMNPQQFRVQRAVAPVDTPGRRSPRFEQL